MNDLYLRSQNERTMKNEIKQKIMEKVIEYNEILRKELLEQLTSGKITMKKFEEKSGLIHSFCFYWRDGKNQLRNIENFITVMKVLKKRVRI